MDSLFIFLIIIVVIGSLSYLVLKMRVRGYIDREYGHLVSEMSDISSRKVKVDLTGAPKWAQEEAEQHRSEVSKHIIHFNHELDYLGRLKTLKMETAKRAVRGVQSSINDGEAHVIAIEELPAMIEEYQANAKSLQESCAKRLREIAIAITSNAGEFELDLDHEYNLVYEMVVAHEKLVIDPENLDSYRDVYLGSKKFLEKADNTFHFVQQAVMGIQEARLNIESYESNIQVLEGSRSDQTDAYRALCKEHKGSAMDLLGSRFKHFETTLDLSERTISSMKTLAKKPTEKEVSELGDTVKQALEVLDESMQFPRYVQSTKKELEEAKAKAQEKLKTYKDSIEKAKAKSKQANASSRSKDLARRAENRANDLHGYEDDDVLDWIIMLEILDDIETTSEASFSEAESSITDAESSIFDEGSFFDSDGDGADFDFDFDFD